jgi:hypothetical protein
LTLLRNKIFLIGALCAAPLVLGTAAYYFGWGTGRHANYGELIAPRPVLAPPFDKLRGKWVLVAFDAAACQADCEKKLYFMRQVRKAQGKDAERVERLLLVTDAATPRAEVLFALENTWTARASEALIAAFPGPVTDHIYLVDPLGNLMLRFPRDPDPSLMNKDLQRLLKYSRFG